jgi:ABC-2 type transport system ATP-binding protein
MLMLAGLLEPTSGSVRLNGQPFTIRDRQLRNCLGVVPQDLAIYPDLTALENLRFFGEIYGLRGERLRQRCATVLEQIGLAQVAQQRAAEFSGGMQRRLNFGIAVLHEPAVLMLDEPTVGVDPQSRVHLLDGIRALAAGGTAILYASHYMEEVQALCQRVAIIDHGRRLAYDTLTNLLEGVTGRILLSVSGAVALHGRLAGAVREIASSSGGVQLEVSAPDGRWEFLLPEVLQQIRLAGVTVERIETSHSDLERLFLSLTGRKLRD